MFRLYLLFPPMSTMFVLYFTKTLHFFGSRFYKTIDIKSWTKKVDCFWHSRNILRWGKNVFKSMIYTNHATLWAHTVWKYLILPFSIFWHFLYLTGSTIFRLPDGSEQFGDCWGPKPNDESAIFFPWNKAGQGHTPSSKSIDCYVSCKWSWSGMKVWKEYS